VFDSEMFLQP